MCLWNRRLIGVVVPELQYRILSLFLIVVFDCFFFFLLFFFQAEDGIRVLVRSRGLGDVYKRQVVKMMSHCGQCGAKFLLSHMVDYKNYLIQETSKCCLLYTSDAADERSSVDLGGRRIIKKKNNVDNRGDWCDNIKGM